MGISKVCHTHIAAKEQIKIQDRLRKKLHLAKYAHVAIDIGALSISMMYAHTPTCVHRIVDRQMWGLEYWCDNLTRHSSSDARHSAKEGVGVAAIKAQESAYAWGS